MTEFERAVVLLLATQVELLRDSAAYHSPATEEDRTREIPSRLLHAMQDLVPEAAEIIEGASLRRQRGVPKLVQP